MIPYSYGRRFACEAKGLKMFYKTRHASAFHQIEPDQDSRLFNQTLASIVLNDLFLT